MEVQSCDARALVRGGRGHPDNKGRNHHEVPDGWTEFTATRNHETIVRDSPNVGSEASGFPPTSCIT